jgi:hypothetical protein
MKCRRWGHLAKDCIADADTCGKCGEDHHTATCINRSKTHCINCNNSSHTSWSRDCPEFMHRCMIMDERIPENSMPFFPMEHDWTLVTRPIRVLMEERFPPRYTVQNLPYAGYNMCGPNHNTHPKRCKGQKVQKGKDPNPNTQPLGSCKDTNDPPSDPHINLEYGYPGTGTREPE